MSIPEYVRVLRDDVAAHFPPSKVEEELFRRVMELEVPALQRNPAWRDADPATYKGPENFGDPDGDYWKTAVRRCMRTAFEAVCELEAGNGKLVL